MRLKTHNWALKYLRRVLINNNHKHFYSAFPKIFSQHFTEVIDRPVYINGIINTMYPYLHVRDTLMVRRGS